MAAEGNLFAMELQGCISRLKDFFCITIMTFNNLESFLCFANPAATGKNALMKKLW